MPRLNTASSLNVNERPWKLEPSYRTTRVRPPPQPPPGPGAGPGPPPAIGRKELTRPVTPPRFGHCPGPSTSHELWKSESAQSCLCPALTMADCARSLKPVLSRLAIAPLTLYERPVMPGASNSTIDAPGPGPGAGPGLDP